MSWTAISESPCMSSRHASMSSFSRKGSPTWTVGRFASASSSNAADAIEAPWMPSRPVLLPTHQMGLPGASARARKMRSAGAMPSAKALTSGFSE